MPRRNYFHSGRNDRPARSGHRDRHRRCRPPSPGPWRRQERETRSVSFSTALCSSSRKLPPRGLWKTSLGMLTSSSLTFGWSSTVLQLTAASWCPPRHVENAFPSHRHARKELGPLSMIAFTIIATLVSHRFQEFQHAARQLQYVNFMKNLAIIGGFTVLYTRGAGRLSLDRTSWRAGRCPGTPWKNRQSCAKGCLAWRRRLCYNLAAPQARCGIGRLSRRPLVPGSSVGRAPDC